jgi:UDP-N-acetylglucosamine diphosphorylase/glucosamine-1-phosphate N-acetyltransferase
MKDIGIVILAAGEGTRMKSNRAKVLHEVAGVPMIRYVVETALANSNEVIVVVGHQAGAVQEALVPCPTLRFALQKEQLGTGHAVLCALPELGKDIQDVVVLCGDTPLIRPETVGRLIDAHRDKGSLLSLLTTVLSDPFGYGRIVLDENDDPKQIVEESDANESERQIQMVNTGTYCIGVDFLRRALAGLNNQNAQGEFYLTDVLAAAYEEGKPAVLVNTEDSRQVMGINTVEELAKAEAFVLQGANEGSQNPLDFSRGARL